MTYDFFVAGKWRNREEIIKLIYAIREKGYTVYNFFEGDGSEYSLKNLENEKDPESFMETFENIPDWDTDENIRKIFEMDMNGLKNSNNFILLLPAGKSAHIEAGVAYGLNKKCILIGEQKETESLYFIFDKKYQTVDEFLLTI